MPLLRKSGVRAPWMPAPLPVADTNPPRRTSVVPGWQPTPTGGVVWLRSVRETPVVTNTDPRRPVTVISGWQPTPSNGALWLRPPVTPPNTDPLRPLTLEIGQQPLPDSPTVWLRSVRETPVPPNTDPRRPVSVLSGQQPVPLGVVLWLTVPKPPNTDPLRPLVIEIGQQPTPSNSAIWLRPPVTPPNADPLRPLIVRLGWQPIPGNGAIWLRTTRPPNTDPRRPILVRPGQQPLPGFGPVWLRSVRETPIVFTPLPGNIAVVGAQARRYRVNADVRSIVVHPSRHLFEAKIMGLATVNKDPGAALDYKIVWSTYLDALEATDTIVSSTWSVDGSGLTIDASTFDTTTTTVRLEGGTVGQKYKVKNTVTLASGQVEVRRIIVVVMEL